MDKTTETTNSPTTNGSHQHAAAATATANSKAGGGGGISDRPPSTTLSSTTQQIHDNISLGCGPTTRLPTARTQAATTSTAVNAKDSNKLTNMACTSSSVVSAAASTNQITAATKSSLPKSTIINGKHCITQLGMPLPATLQQQNLAGLINLNINTTTGGNFGVTVDPSISVENLKKIIAKKLKVAKDRICLLHREKELQDGTLKDNNLMDGSKIILIPNVETGLLAQRPENTVMQALESLNDSQVNDFLSGKTPLNLSMRLGDHMMLIQLQLSTVNPANNAVGGAHQGSGGSCSSTRIRSSSQRSSRSSNGTNITAAASAAAQAHHSHHHHHHYHHNSNAATSQTTQSTSTQQQQPQQNNVSTSAARKLDLDANSGSTTCQRSITIHTNASNNRSTITTALQANNSPASTTTKSIRSSDLSTFLSKRDYESLQNIVKSIAMSQPAARLTNAVVNATNAMSTGHSVNATTAHNQTLRATLPSATNNGTTIGTATTPMSISTFHAIASAATASKTLQTAAAAATAASSATQRTDPVLLEQSPIKSLSNLVSSPIKTTAIKNIPIAATSASAHNGNHNSSSGTAAATAAATCQQDPIVAKLTSCLCTRLNASNSSISARHCIENSCLARQDVGTSQQQQLQPQQLSSSSHQQRHIMITSTPNSKSQAPTAAATATTTTTAIAISSNSNIVLHKTANNPITRSKHRHHHHHHHHHHHYHHHNAAAAAATSASNNAATSAQQRLTIKPQVASVPRCYSVNSNDSGFASDDSLMTTTAPTAAAAATTTTLPPPAALAPAAPTAAPATASASNAGAAVAAAATTTTTATATATTTATAVATTNTNSSTTTFELDDSGVALTTDTRTLAEASRNLTQTLRKLSKEVFTNKIDLSSNDEAAQRKSGSGAVIESMKNHGKGIYSGTFSGTLNPALQDRYGRPKRDISTVIHILNDLLSATPQYSRGARISFEAPTTSAAAAAAAAANGTDGSSSGLQHSSRNKQLSSKHHSHSCVKCIKAAHAHAQAHAHAHAHTSNTNSSSNSSSANNNSQCNYGECNGHYKTHTKTVYACCQDASAAAAAAAGTTATTTTVHTANANSNQNVTLTNERNACNCRYRLHGETGERVEREREYTCQKCLSDMDNLKTKSKMNQIRLVMQQTKQKREARKLKGAPYGAPRVLGATTTTAATTTATAVTAADAAMLAAASTTSSNPTTLNNATAATTLATTSASAATSEVSPNHLVEEVDTAA